MHCHCQRVKVGFGNSTICAVTSASSSIWKPASTFAWKKARLWWPWGLVPVNIARPWQSSYRAGRAKLVQASGLYSRLRAENAFSGSELNVEGAVFIDGWVRIFNRGNGAWRDDIPPRDASCDIPWPEFEAYLRDPTRQTVPSIQQIVQYDLGDILGAPLTFTDATVTEAGLVYTAAAEDSPDAVTDGMVAGSAIGILDHFKGNRWIELRNQDGDLIVEKIEGICPARGQEGRIYVVVDADDPARPSILCDRAEDATPTQTIALDPLSHRTYHYWHVLVPKAQPGQLYAYRVHGPFDPARGLRFDASKLLLDP